MDWLLGVISCSTLTRQIPQMISIITEAHNGRLWFRIA